MPSISPFTALVVDARLALRNILRQRRRTVIALMAIGCGVVAILLASGFIEWIFREMREDAIANQYGHIQVVRPGYHDHGQADPFAFLMPQSAPALTALEELPGLESVVPRLAFLGLVSHGDSSLSFIGEGIDPARDPSLRSLQVTQGKGLQAGDTSGILMGAGLAANLGVSAGDTVVLMVTTSGGGINAVEGKVQGLFFTSNKAIDDAVLKVPVATARKLLRVKGSHAWVVTLRHTETTAAALKYLQKQPSFSGLEVVPWTKLADFYNKTVELFSRQIGVVKLIIALIIILSIGNTMTMTILERTVEIGTVMAMGVKRRRILGLFLIEGGLLGVLGGTIGVSVGYLLSKMISFVGIPMPPAPGMSEGFKAAIIVTAPMMGEALLLAIVTTLIATVYPAWRGSRLVIVDALRHNS